jgi:integrase
MKRILRSLLKTNTHYHTHIATTCRLAYIWIHGDPSYFSFGSHFSLNIQSNTLRRVVDRSLLQGESIEQFRAAIPNPVTRDSFERSLVRFLKSVKMGPDDFVAKAKSQPSRIEKTLISFISKENERVEKREITAGTLANALKPIKILFEMNDVISINWKKIKRVVPKARRYALDRVPTIDEIQNIVEAADIRGKALTLVLISSGIREGGIEQLKVGDYMRLEAAGRLTVYNGDPERYVTFISPEACDALDKYLTFRRQHGEIVSGESPLFRDIFDAIKKQDGHTRRDARVAIPMTGSSIRQYYNRLLFSIRIRNQKKRRHDFTVNGFRKYFKTKAEQAGMKPINIEILMGHSVGISDSYYRPTEDELLQDYSRVTDALTVSPENKLRHELETRGRSMEMNLREKERKIANLETEISEISRRLYEVGILKKD